MNSYTGSGIINASGSGTTTLQLQSLVNKTVPADIISINYPDIWSRAILPGDIGTYNLLKGKNSGRQANANFIDAMLDKQSFTAKGKNTGRKANLSFSDILTGEQSLTTQDVSGKNTGREANANFIDVMINKQDIEAKGKNTGRKANINFTDVLTGKQSLTTQNVKGKNGGRKANFSFVDKFFWNNVEGDF